MILALRVHTEILEEQSEQDQAQEPAAPKRPRAQPPKLAPCALVFDTETTLDIAQSLTFGVSEYLELVRAPHLSAGFEYVTARIDIFHRSRVSKREELRLNEAAMQLEALRGVPVIVGSREEWLVRMFLPVAKRLKGFIVGFNLPFDLSRIAVAADWRRLREPHRPIEGASLQLANQLYTWYGVLVEDKLVPRIRIEAISGKAALIGFQSTMPVSGKPRWGAGRGRFLDTRTLLWAMRNESYSLKSACEDFATTSRKMNHAPTGKITVEEALYCANDVRCTSELLNASLREFVQHGIDLLPERAYSPASIAKAYQKKMGMVPPAEKFKKVDPKMQGRAMNAYFGGVSECRIRHTPVPGIFVDIKSTYPTVYTNMGLWDIARAGELRVEDCTGEVRSLLDSITLEDAFDRSKWPGFAFYAEVAPGGDLFPVRTFYQEQDSSSGIGLNPLSFESRDASADSRLPEDVRAKLAALDASKSRTCHYAGPDLIAAKFLSGNGKIPKVLRAWRLVPVGVQDGLAPVKLFDGTVVDPRSEDFYKAVVEARFRSHVNPELTEDQRANTKFALKVLANAGSYGLLVELNTQPTLRDGEKVQVHVDGPDFARPLRMHTVEEPGAWYLPLLGALIPAAARLMLAMAQCRVKELGGEYILSDTDALCIAASGCSALWPCAGGSHRIPGEECEGLAQTAQSAIKLLSRKEVLEQVVAPFSTLNPYDPALVPGSILDVQLESDRRELFVLSIAAKRYVVYERAGNDIKIVKVSLHGLGHLMSPDDRYDNRLDCPEWIREAWEWIIKTHLKLPCKKPSWWDLPAVMPVRASTESVIRSVQERSRRNGPYEQQVKPFNFCMVALMRRGELPIAPIEHDSSKWWTLNWRGTKTGRRIYLDLGRGEHNLDVLTLGELVERHLDQTEDKSLGPSGNPCNARTRGLLRRRPVVATGMQYIGKETDVRYGLDSEDGVGDKLEPDYIVYSLGPGAAKKKREREARAQRALKSAELAEYRTHKRAQLRAQRALKRAAKKTKLELEARVRAAARGYRGKQRERQIAWAYQYERMAALKREKVQERLNQVKVERADQAAEERRVALTLLASSGVSVRRGVSERVPTPKITFENYLAWCAKQERQQQQQEQPEAAAVPAE